jgi:hypothetical protein
MATSDCTRLADGDSGIETCISLNYPQQFSGNNALGGKSILAIKGSIVLHV